MRISLALCAALAASASARTIDIDWRVQKTYKDMQLVEADPGDVLRFNWVAELENGDPNVHNVVRLKNCDPKKQRWNKFKCPNMNQLNENNSEDLGMAPGVEYIVPDDATLLCFVCTVGGHCQGGQHSTVIVKQPEPPLVVTWGWGMPDKDNFAKVKPGQEILFNWSVGHNLILATTRDGAGFANPAYFPCDDVTPEKTWNDGPHTWTVPADAAPGSFFNFYCGYSGHCKGGNQHLTVKVESDADPLAAVKERCLPKPAAADCKACGGKPKGSKCKFKAKKVNSFKCSKVKNNREFCAAVGCTPKGTSKCKGQPGAK